MNVSFRNTLVLFIAFTLVMILLPKPARAVDFCWDNSGCPEPDRVCWNDGEGLTVTEWYCSKIVYIGGVCSTKVPEDIPCDYGCFEGQCNPPPTPCPDLRESECLENADRCRYCDIKTSCMDRSDYVEACNKPQCSDEIDNDNDGCIDYGYDTGCTSPEANSESGGCCLENTMPQRSAGTSCQKYCDDWKTKAGECGPKDAEKKCDWCNSDGIWEKNSAECCPPIITDPGTPVEKKYCDDWKTKAGECGKSVVQNHVLLTLKELVIVVQHIVLLMMVVLLNLVNVE